MAEIATNVFIKGTMVANTLENPRIWLENHDSFEIRYVGGIYNLSKHNKRRWAKSEPTRIVETGTGREEVWFPPEWKAPDYISLDPDGNLTSHVKHDRRQPTVVQSVRQKGILGAGLTMVAEHETFYVKNKLHSEDKSPAIASSRAVMPVMHECITAIQFDLILEYWSDGEWNNSIVSGIKFIFSNPKLNTPERQDKALRWIARNCIGGFFPFEDEPFREIDDEVMFLADICS